MALIDTKKIRKAAGGLSQQEFADKTHIPKGRINGWEQSGSNPKTEDFNKIKKFLSENKLSHLIEKQEEFSAEISGGEIMEKLIGLQARTTVLQAQLISWASKMKDDPGELMMRLQQAEQKEVNRLLDELRRK
jgi:transcriptional regulator with XRE-family HTH domain